MLAQVILNSQIPYIDDFLRIVAALCNVYRPPRVEAASPDDEIIAQRMLAQNRNTNNLQKYIKGIKRLIIWRKIEVTSIADFPRLTLDDLHKITIGVYQLKQTSSYTREHMSDEGNYVLYVRQEESDILKVKLQSRHTSSKQYQL